MADAAHSGVGPTPSPPVVTVARVQGVEQVESRLATLAAIPVPDRTPMHHEAWLRACALAFDADGSFEIITTGDPARPTAGAAFARRGRSGRRLSLLGAEELWEPVDVFYQDPEDAHALARAVVERGRPIRFGHFAADSPFLDALRSSAGGKALVVADAVGGSPVLSLDNRWTEPERAFSARGQRDLRRKRRKADGLGSVTFDVVVPTTEDVDRLLEEAIGVEAASWKGRSRTAIALDTTLQHFFATYARLATDAGVLRFSFLRIDGNAVAVQIGVVSDGAEWQLKIGYDERYRDCSPGSLLMLEVIRHAAEIGLERFEFLGKAAPWTRQWTDQQRPMVRLRVYPYNTAGGATLITDAARVIPRRIRAWAKARRDATPP